MTTKIIGGKQYSLYDVCGSSRQAREEADKARKYYRSVRTQFVKLGTYYVWVWGRKPKAKRR